MYLKIARAIFHGIKLIRPMLAKRNKEKAIEVYDVEKSKELSKSALTFGILGISFSLAGVLAILGVIFSIVAKRKANAYEKLTGRVKGRTAVGKFLGSAGIAVGVGIAGISRTLKSLTRFIA